MSGAWLASKLQRQARLNVALARALPLWARWLFLATNAAFVVAAGLTLRRGVHLEQHPYLPRCCASAAAHAALLVLAGAASFAFHGVQCDVAPSLTDSWLRKARRGGPLSFLNACCRCCSPDFGPSSSANNTNNDNDAPPPTHAALAVGFNLVDVVCASSCGGFLLLCNGRMGLRTCLRCAPAAACLVLSAKAKRRRAFRTYALLHASWHLEAARLAYCALQGGLQ